MKISPPLFLHSLPTQDKETADSSEKEEKPWFSLLAQVTFKKMIKFIKETEQPGWGGGDVSDQSAKTSFGKNLC